jgi:hypothetical protein
MVQMMYKGRMLEMWEVIENERIVIRVGQEEKRQGFFLHASKVSASLKSALKPVCIRRWRSWECLFGNVHAYAGCDRRVFVLTPRAAYQPPIPRNSEMFLRSVGRV